jgi:hypothetical protein
MSKAVKQVRDHWTVFVMIGCACAPIPAPTGGTAPHPAARATAAVPSTGVTATKPGLFTVHTAGDKLYFEIPRRELSKEILVVRRTIAGDVSSPGLEIPTLVRFPSGEGRVVVLQQSGNRLLLRQKSYQVRADSSATIFRAVEAITPEPIIAVLNIERFGRDSAPLVDVTELFTSNVGVFETAPVRPDLSVIEGFAAFPENVNVEATRASTQADGGITTERISWSFYKLPERPMRPRLYDKRVGNLSDARPVSFIDYSRPEHGAIKRQFILRFRLERQHPGAEMSDPVKPIVFWVDPATPTWLVPWVKRGVEAWAPAFRDAGFSNAIMAKEAPSPEADPDWSMYDARHSVIYWAPTTNAGAAGDQVVDPRTGEIIRGEIQIGHNLMSLLRTWYVIGASPLDPRARRLPLPDSLMGRLVQAIVEHEVGHAIGLEHNIKASALYPTDSLRSASFLRRMGHTPSVMDRGRINYVAQPEDGIPPELLLERVGPYDHFMVMWQHKEIPGAHTPDDEWATLDQWSRMQDTIPWLRFNVVDATADAGFLGEAAVGDADAVRASTLGMKNLRRVMGMLLAIAERPGQDYALLKELYEAAVLQWTQCNWHVAAILGGVEAQERYGTGPRFRPLSGARQRAAMRYLAEHAFQVPAMFTDTVILRRIEQDGVVARFGAAQDSLVQSLLSERRLNRVIEFEALAGPRSDRYPVTEFLASLRQSVWGELAEPRPRVDVYRRSLQRAYIAAAERVIQPPPPAAAPPSGTVFSADPPRRLTSDARALLRGELVELRQTIQAVLPRTDDRTTRLHLHDLAVEIDRILK